jgi:hypothetical protein
MPVGTWRIVQAVLTLFLVFACVIIALVRDDLPEWHHNGVVLRNCPRSCAEFEQNQWDFRAALRRQASIGVVLGESGNRHPKVEHQPYPSFW